MALIVYLHFFRDRTSPFVVKIIRTKEEELVVGEVVPIPIWEAHPEPEVDPPAEAEVWQVATDTDPVEIVSAVQPVRTAVIAIAGRVV